MFEDLYVETDSGHHIVCFSLQRRRRERYTLADSFYVTFTGIKVNTECST